MTRFVPASVVRLSVRPSVRPSGVTLMYATSLPVIVLCYGARFPYVAVQLRNRRKKLKYCIRFALLYRSCTNAVQSIEPRCRADMTRDCSQRCVTLSSTSLHWISSSAIADASSWLQPRHHHHQQEAYGKYHRDRYISIHVCNAPIACS